MSYEFYKIAHLLGLMLVFSGLGGQFVQAINGEGSSAKARRLIGMFHGIGLLLLVVAGFGMLAKLQIPIQGWVVAKLGIWVVLGGVGAVASRKKSAAASLWVGALVLGVLAAYLAQFKPF